MTRVLNGQSFYPTYIDVSVTAKSLQYQTVTSRRLVNTQLATRTRAMPELEVLGRGRGQPWRTGFTCYLGQESGGVEGCTTTHFGGNGLKWRIGIYMKYPQLQQVDPELQR